jgi:hypothetical protein
MLNTQNTARRKSTGLDGEFANVKIQCLHRSFHEQVAKVLKCAARAFVPALGVYMGVALGMRAHTLSGGRREALHALRSIDTVSHNEQTTKIGRECYGMLAAKDTLLPPTSELGAGVAEVFDSDGHLIMRYQANERAGSQWDVTEYVQRPVANGSADLTAK